MLRPVEEFKGTRRFKLRRRLGAGGMGVVYEAFDHERQAPVALKTLLHLDADSLYRFKNEFRTLADLSHRNLVRLDELHCEDGHWFFTMELVQGVDFLAWVRPLDPRCTSARSSHQGPTMEIPALGDTAQVTMPEIGGPASAAFDEKRLRAAFEQLALGLDSLHRAGKVHRDVKPSNLLVAPDGRVVVLDFGLATDIRGKTLRDSGIVGTADYMAPEQALGQGVGPEADWYAAGVVLYEALTGRVPFSGRPIDVVIAKQQHTAPPPSRLIAGVPEDLDRLCAELLHLSPARRPSGPQLLTRLGVGRREGAITQGNPFVGRSRELAILHQAFRDSLREHPLTVLVLGESGLGKSALVRRFVEELEAADPAPVVLTGRCYERESVPFKAFDGVIDALSRHLMQLDQKQVDHLLPVDAALVARVFPVLRRVPAIAHVPQPVREIPDPVELRTRAFTALRRLLAALSTLAPLVVFIDDLQWADADSLALLDELLDPGEPPTVLLVATVRTERGEVDVPKQLLRPLGEVRRLPLEGLDAKSSEELVQKLLDRPNRAAHITREAAGHPLFIQELCYYAQSSGDETSKVRLDEALWARANRQEDAAQRVLQLVAVAGAPIRGEVLAHAAQLGVSEFLRVLGVLRASHLLRASGERSADRIEPYHNRVRDIVLSRLDEPARRACHSALADALEATGGTDPLALVRHLEAAGEARRAASHAWRAARMFADALAFDQAADLYRTALLLGKHDEQDRRELLLGLADALVSAGHSAEAAHYFTEAAKGADAATRLDCQRRAAEHYLVSGHIQPGLQSLRAVLDEVGVDFPRSPARALVSVLWQRLRVRMRGLRWQKRDESQVSPHDLVRLDVYRSVSLGLGMVDTIRGASFHQTGLLLALKLGEARRIGRFVAHEAIYVAAEGWQREKQVVRLIELAEHIAEETGDPFLRAWTLAATGTSNYLLAGRFKLSLEQVREAEHAFRNLAGAAWEIDSLRFFGLFSLRHLGAMRELRKNYDEYVRDAARRGDRYAETTMAKQVNIGLLADDRPDDARRMQDRSTWVPPTQAFHLQHWYSVRADSEIGLYRGQLGSSSTWRRTLQAMSKSLLVRIQTVRAEAVWLDGRLLLAQAAAGTDKARALPQVIACARRLERDKTGYGRVWAELLRAGVARQREQPEACAAHLRAAITTADANDMHLCAAAARSQLADCIGGDEGGTLRARADTWFAGEGVRRPERLIEVVAPGLRKK